MEIKPSSSFPSEIIEQGGKTLMLCFQCGTCTGSCPSGRVTAFRTRKLIRKAQLGLRDEVLSSEDLWLCTTCYTCHERCPRGVEIPDIIMVLRNLAVRAGYMAEPHKRAAGVMVKTGHLIPFDDKGRENRRKVGLDEVPPTSLSRKEALKELEGIVRKTGFSDILKIEKGKGK